MKVNFELPHDILLVKREDLRAILQDILAEVDVQIKKGEIMTIPQAAEYLQVSVPTVRNMIANKDIPFFKRGQVIRLNRWDIQEWLRDNSRQQG